MAPLFAMIAGQDCMTTAVIAKDGGPAVSTGVCDGVDQKGNLWWAWVRSADQPA